MHHGYWDDYHDDGDLPEAHRALRCGMCGAEHRLYADLRKHRRDVHGYHYGRYRPATEARLAELLAAFPPARWRPVSNRQMLVSDGTETRALTEDRGEWWSWRHHPLGG